MCEEFISGDKFIDLADHQYNKLNDYTNIYPIPTYLSPIIIYCHTEFVNQLFIDAKNCMPFILISHNGDGKVTLQPNKYDADANNIPSNLIHWFATNVQTKHNKITCIPTGLENQCWFPEINKQKQVFEIQTKPKIYANLCYMNFNLNTNYNERTYLYNLLKNQPWVTCDMHQNGYNFAHYIKMIHSHYFVLCPEGNQNTHCYPGGASGSHRFWECLYAKSIPVLTDGIQTSFFKHLPILSIEKWDDITETFLTQKLNEILNIKYDLSSINLSYWKQQINSVKEKWCQ